MTIYDLLDKHWTDISFFIVMIALAALVFAGSVGGKK